MYIFTFGPRKIWFRSETLEEINLCDTGPTQVLNNRETFVET